MLKQVFIINNDLKMGKGKIAVQVAHGEVEYMNMLLGIHNRSHQKFKSYYKWTDGGVMKKVVLKATEKEIMAVYYALNHLHWRHIVYDMGLTQIPKNSVTCLVVEPLEEEQCDKLFRHFKLL